ncbi:DNA/RNA endonuclease G [Microbacterium sp. W1N]|uniref:DNA/RNA endonuclease G n=1 Tax=Microbacterium festucae TaxID=2977531 RepID=UPI0021BFA7E7|nr:DNA/RNA endonuclease G [Microbacterium festucae]MCT9821424.1 DNA/RNA endonuclease G [Microbacterium festucae]
MSTVSPARPSAPGTSGDPAVPSAAPARGTPALARVVRRETHSPRTVAMFAAVVLVILALVYVGTEIVLSLLGAAPLLVAPGPAFGWVVALPTAEPAAAVIAGGVGIAVVGAVLVVLAVAPGRLPKHELQWGERAVVVDNGVIAAALAQHLSLETGLARDKITVGVAHRSIDITLAPAAGEPLDVDRVRALADAEIARFQLARPVRTQVRVARAPEQEWDR